MIRTLSTIAFASFILAVACLAGAAALGGRELVANGWVIPGDWQVKVGDDVGVRAGRTDRATRDLPWTGGDSLTLDLPADVTYVQAAEAKITLSGPRDIIDRVVVEGSRIAFSNSGGDGDVTIDVNGIRVVDDSERLRITVSGPDVSRFTVNDSGDLEIEGYDQPRLEVKVQGSGDVTAAGRADKIAVDVVGSGRVDLSDLKTVDADVSTSGSGDATIAATGAVKVAIAGSGGVSLRAKPASLASEVMGSGDVDKDY